MQQKAECVTDFFFVDRAFWAYHEKFQPQAQHLLNSLDTQLQKHINEEKFSNAKLPPSSSRTGYSIPYHAYVSICHSLLCTGF